jgi:hypothetical protein
LKEFFDDHREGAVGVFASGEVNVERGALNVEGEGPTPAAPTRDTQRSTTPQSSASSLTADTWLTPFDLGLRQRTQILIEPGAFPEIFEVRVVPHPHSAATTAISTASTALFLGELRKQFLRWRSLPPAAIARYVAMSRKN